MTKKTSPLLTGTKGWLIYSTGVILLFLMSLTSSWVYYLGTDKSFQWMTHLVTRFPSYGLWIALIPLIFTMVKNRIDRYGLSSKPILQLTALGMVLALFHRPVASFLSAVVTGTAGEFYSEITSVSAFQILAYVLDSYLVFLLLAGTRITETALRIATSDREKALQLERNLASSRLQTLSIQFQPHFIFNSLQGLSMLVYKDPETADSMITTLSDLLRASSRMAEIPFIPLAEELALAEKYMSIQQIRFGPRLTVANDIASECLSHKCPPFILQPLFENAIKHAVELNPDTTHISLKIDLHGNQLVLLMSNSLPPDHTGSTGGTGLDLIRERLDLLYSGSAHFSCKQTNSEFLVEMKIPINQ